MDGFVKAFLKASLAWLVAGTTGGIAMAMVPAWTVHRPAHAHSVVLGFVAMMIYGVAYHVIPRFAGAPLPSRTAPIWHWWLSNAGLLLMVSGFITRASAHSSAAASAGSIMLASGGTLAAAGAWVFAVSIWLTIDRGAPAVVPIAKLRTVTGQ
ncbi:MAG: cbb3-type cytochrome c oxidase subunit I [Gemmatimonadaceae bacterium]|nr:cbb3-type cytochrome c oxidase subunit I [Gemmatimonadaceae bacterium]